MFFALILFFATQAWADLQTSIELHESATLASDFLSISEFTTPGEVRSCSAPANYFTRKKLFVDNLKTAPQFSSVARSKCDEITIYYNKTGQKSAIGYYACGDKVVCSFHNTCENGASDKKCQEDLKNNFERMKSINASSKAEAPKKDLFNPTYKAAIDNVYVAKNYQVNLEVKIPKNATLQGYTCPDKTLSAEQGSSWGVGGWEGRCGQTAATNLLYSLCGHLSPSLVKTGECSREDSAFNDITPGVMPTTMAEDYNDFLQANGCAKKKVTHGYRPNTLVEQYFEGKVTLAQTMKVQESAIEAVVKEGNPHPTMFMIEVPGSKELHWISLEKVYTDAKGVKTVKVNHWGSQYDYPLSEVAKLTLKAGYGDSGVGGIFADLNYVQVK
ncbi:MAG: hypothetical protein K2P81_01535 [Bacteriovoracaceae bacterium]|nr:hypothetical protein [Bacteriovoracaceae bacterium]